MAEGYCWPVIVCLKSFEADGTSFAFGCKAYRGHGQASVQSIFVGVSVVVDEGTSMVVESRLTRFWDGRVVDGRIVFSLAVEISDPTSSSKWLGREESAVARAGWEGCERDSFSWPSSCSGTSTALWGSSSSSSSSSSSAPSSAARTSPNSPTTKPLSRISSASL